MNETTIETSVTSVGGDVVPYPSDFVERYRGAGLWGSKTIADELTEVAQRVPTQLAVVAADGQLTYRELATRSDQIGAGLLDLGLVPGERVLLQAPNSVNTVLAWYGLLKAGIVPVCTLPLHRAHEIGAIAHQCDAAAHLVDAGPGKFDLVAFAQQVATEHPHLRHLLTINGRRPGAVDIASLVSECDPAAARERIAEVQAQIDPDATAVLQLSGGTTGVPKLIPRLHAEYWYNARAYAAAWEWDESSRVAHILPIIHNAGIVCAVHAAHSVGATLLLSDPVVEVAVPFLAEHAVTDLVLIPGIVTSVGIGAWLPALHAVRHVIMAGSKVPVTLFEELERSGVWMGQLFGMGEGLFMITPLDSPATVRSGTVGAPMSPLDEIKVVIPGTDVEVPDGAEGELVCRGPYTIRGYYRAQEHNANAFTADGFYRTGDVVVRRLVDGARSVSIEGRIKDLIDRGGEKINASEIEALLMDHPAIAEAAIVAMPDERLGERACAFVVFAAGHHLDIDELRRHLNGRGVARFKWPERIEAVDELPRTNVSKVNKKELRSVIAAKLHAERLDHGHG